MRSNPSLGEHVDALAAYLPSDRMFEAKGIKGSNFRDLLTGLSGELRRAQGLIAEMENEFFPDATVQYLPEWEQFLQIPDGCFSGSGTQAERRRDILAKLASLGVQTAQDFIDLAQIYGVTITVTPGVSDGYTIVIGFPLAAGTSWPYTWPITWGDPLQALLTCLFNRIKPANCRVQFVTI